MSERVNVSVLVTIDGEPVVDDVYETNSRMQAAGDFEDWADSILNAKVGQPPTSLPSKGEGER